MVRLSKVFVAASLSLYCLLVALGNVTDYDSNSQFVQHVLAMDTVFADSKLKWRAITNPVLQAAAYWGIIAAEALAGVAFAAAAWRMQRALRAPKPAFVAARQTMAVGVTIAFALWFVGFLAIGGEWFAMWQSSAWNGQRAAFMFVMAVMVSAIYVMLDTD